MRGPFTKKDDEKLPFKEAYGKVGPLREAPYGEVPPFTKKYDEEAYGKAEPLREAPYGEGRSLREGPILTGRARVLYGAGSLHREERPLSYGEEFPIDQKKSRFFFGLGHCWPFCPLRRFTGRLGLYGKPLTGRDGPYGKGRSLREGPLRGWLPSQKRTTKRLTGRLSPYGKPFMGRDGPYGRAGPCGKGRGWKVRGETLPELGDVRLCARPKKAFFS